VRPDELTVVIDPPQLALAATRLFVAAAAEAIGRHGRFDIALSGGSTPRQLYQLLATAPWSRVVHWSRCHFFWVDERLVPPDHEESNFRLAQETFLSKLPIAPGQIHRPRVEAGDPEAVATGYEREMREFFLPSPLAPQRPPGDVGSDSHLPRLDLVLLGLGADGHTASLFPGAAASQEAERWVVSTPPGSLPPRVWRVTMTLPAINAARAVAILVSGPEKGRALKSLLEGDESLPASRVRPSDGKLLWMVDRAALEAAGLGL